MEALEAVLADAQGRYDRILCLGDLVGYGADPNRVVEWAQGAVEATVRGNHDRACAGLDSLELYNPAARASAIWTRRTLTAENRIFLERLPRGPLRLGEPPAKNGFDLAHGSPLDEDEYLIGLADAQRLMGELETRLTFFGHTHVQGGFLIARQGVRRIPADRVLELEPEYYYVVNPGSVGQPRDRDPRSAYAIYTPEEHRIEYHRVAYDIEAAATKIRIAGLPEPLAARLFEGM